MVQCISCGYEIDSVNGAECPHCKAIMLQRELPTGSSPNFLTPPLSISFTGLPSELNELLVKNVCIAQEVSIAS